VLNTSEKFPKYRITFLENLDAVGSAKSGMNDADQKCKQQASNLCDRRRDFASEMPGGNIC